MQQPIRTQTHTNAYARSKQTDTSLHTYMLHEYQNPHMMESQGSQFCVISPISPLLKK